MIIESQTLPLPTPLDGTHFNTLCRVSTVGSDSSLDHAYLMLTEIYIEALRANEDLADQVMALLESGQIDIDTAIFEWGMIPIREIAADDS